MTYIFAQKYQYELNISVECRVVQNVGQQAEMILSQPLKLDIYIQAKYLDIYIWARYLVSLLPIETPGTDALDRV